MSQTEITFYIERDGDELELAITGDVESVDGECTSCITHIQQEGHTWEGELTEQEKQVAEEELFERFKTDSEIDVATEAADEALVGDWVDTAINNPYGY